MTIEWKAAPGYEGLYEVSTDGQVRTLGRVRRTVMRGHEKLIAYPAKLLAQESMRLNYKRVHLSAGGVKTRISVHRLVLMTFGPKALPGQSQVNHIDGDPSNNALENLEWCTASQNILHSIHVLGHRRPTPKGRTTSRAKAVVGVFPDGGTVSYRSITSAAVDGFGPSSICAVIKGKEKTHKGAVWMYAPSLPAA